MVWRQYIASVGGVRWVVFLCLLFVLAQASHIGTSVWLSYWCDLDIQDQHKPFYISVYVVLVLLVAVFAILRAFWTYRSLILGSQVLHDTMLFRILRAPSTFYDANPVRSSHSIKHVESIGLLPSIKQLSQHPRLRAIAQYEP
jgi:hypothetical protein